jgi:hypothetical protein
MSEVVTYTIYHAFGDKIGCTTNYPHRCYQQGFKDGEFESLKELEFAKKTLDTDKIAEFLERDYQALYGYSYDDASYRNNWGNRSTPEKRRERSSKSGKRAAELGKCGIQNFTREQQSEYGKLGGFATGAAGRASIASPNHSTKKIHTCPICGRTGKVPGIIRHIKSHTKI